MPQATNCRHQISNERHNQRLIVIFISPPIMIGMSSHQDHMVINGGHRYLFVIWFLAVGIYGCASTIPADARMFLPAAQ
jgi:hypothetical protein